MIIALHIFWKEKVANEINRESDFSNFEIFENEKDAWDHLIAVAKNLKDPNPRVSLNVTWNKDDASLSASEWFSDVAEAGHWLFALADDIALKEAKLTN